MAIDTQAVTASLPNGTTVEVAGGGLTLDETWLPYIQANVTIPLPADRGPFNPRLSPPPRVTLTVHQTRYSSTGSATDYASSFNLVIRSAGVGETGGYDLTLASDEVFLDDYAQIESGEAHIFGPTTLATLVPWVVQQVLPGAVFAEIGVDLDLSAYATDFGEGSGPHVLWTVGVGAFSFLQSFIQLAAGRLWVDEAGYWHLSPSPVNAGALLPITSLTGYQDAISRDGTFYNAVALRYVTTQILVDGNEYPWERVDFAKAAVGPYRVYQETRTLGRNSKLPANGVAQYLLARLLAFGRSLTFTALNDFAAVPGRPIAATFPTGATATGRLSAVSWDFTRGEMGIRARDVI